jgi:hypothetical protein
MADYFGGGIANSISGNPTLTGVIFDSNSADCGGGMYNYFSHPTLTDVMFSGNTAKDYGGGMDNSKNSNPILTDVTFNGNSSDREGGGMRNDGPITLTDVIFEKNSAISGGGMESWGDPTLTNVTFSGNTATDIGGGMYNAGNATLVNVRFSGNTAGSEGGGMYNNKNNFSHPTLTDVTFSGNTAGKEGGGMMNDGPATLMNVTFDNNSATIGGGMASASGSPALTDVTLTNVTFSKNTATDYGGGMVNRGGSTLTNVTFSDNSAGSMGGGMFTGGPSILRNTILWGNTAPEEPQVSNHSTITVSIYDSVVQDDCPKGVGDCMNIIADDPLLGTLGVYGGSTQTIPLNLGSSAIDAGDDANCPSTDQRGVARPQGKRCDIGAYEVWAEGVGAGTYDDTDPAWSYSLGWVPYTTIGPYNDTIHYTTTTDATASLTFQAPATFTFYYAKAPSRGTFEIWVDGSLLTTIDPYATTKTWQNTYTSPAYTDNLPHTIKIKNISTGGKQVDIDAITILP